MKMTEKILGIAFLIGLTMKFFLLPLGGTIMTLSLIILSMIYFYLGFALFNQIPLRKIFKRDSYKVTTTLRILGAIGTGIGISTICVGALFKLQHWPLADYNLLIGLILTLIILLIAVFKFIKNKNKYYSQIFKRILIISILGLLLLCTPDMTLIKIQFRNHPEYIKTYEEYSKNPQDEVLHQKMELEYHKATMTKEDFELYKKYILDKNDNK